MPQRKNAGSGLIGFLCQRPETPKGILQSHLQRTDHFVISVPDCMRAPAYLGLPSDWFKWNSMPTEAHESRSDWNLPWLSLLIRPVVRHYLQLLNLINKVIKMSEVEICQLAYTGNCELLKVKISNDRDLLNRTDQASVNNLAISSDACIIALIVFHYN